MRGKEKAINRNYLQVYPDFTNEIRDIDSTLTANGISAELLKKIINKHSYNAAYNKSLYDRYRTIAEGVPIFKRKPVFTDGRPINNLINNDYFSEIIDFKTGYFAGEPISYGYSKGNEAEAVTGGKEAVDTATKAVTDFVTRNNMYGVDMEITKFASIYGYAGRLFYIDTDGEIRVMAVPGYETIILSNTDISEPKYAVRVRKILPEKQESRLIVEFYDNAYIHEYEGYKGSLVYKGSEPHLFDYCPLQGIANNKELMGDAEKVLTLIDDYDKVTSDNSNELESFVHAYMVFKNLQVDDEEINKAQQNGALKIPSVGTKDADVYFLTKNINDGFTEHHLERLQDNIYRFSKTPNLNDESFGSASGVSLKFKLHGLETKCGMFEAKMMDAAQYMWQVLCSAWRKKEIYVDPLQITMEFTRNFPLDTLTEAQTVQTLISAGIPKEIAYSQLSFVDDVNYVMEMMEQQEEYSVPEPDKGNLDNEKGINNNVGTDEGKY